MKLMTNEKYKALMMTLKRQHEIINGLVKENKSIKRDLAYYKLLHNTEYGITHGVIFPNTDERGLGDSGTPTTFPDIF